MKINWKKILFGVSEKEFDPYFHLERGEEHKLLEIKEALAKAKISEALHTLGTLPSSATEQHVIAFSSRYHRLEEEQIQGTLQYEDYQIGLNRLSSDILKLVQLLEKTFNPEATIQEVKSNLRDIYLQRLQDKLAERHPINIQCAYSLTGTDWDRAQIAYDEIVLSQQEVSSSLERIFDTHRGRLLVIGDPGAGKTSLLLQLADALLRRRENRVPVILNLSTWNQEYDNLEKWLLESLPRAASISKAYAKTLIQEDRLLPLFDGLDEVKAEYRRACLDAIAQYGQAAEHQYVICSRTREYAEIGAAPVYAQIELQPLKAEQIRAELEQSNQPEAKFLLHAIQNDPLLAEVVRNPFYFNTTQLLLASMKTYDSLGIQANTVEELQKVLVEKFVAQQLNTTVKRSFPAEKSRKWLGFMAKKMEENGLAVFELVDLNLGWVGTESKLLYFLFGGVYFLYIFSFVENGLIEDFPSATLLYLLLVFIWILSSSGHFLPPKRIIWSFEKLKENKKKIGLGVLGTIAMFFYFIFYSKVKEIEGLFFVGFGKLFLGSFLIAFIFGICIKLIKNIWFQFIFTLAWIIIEYGLKIQSFEKKKNPFIIFLISLSREVFFYVLAALIFYFSSERSNDLWLEALFGFIFILPLILFFRYLLLMLAVSITKMLPFDLLTFLREMDARHIFESPGGTWRFRHKILQDYFIQEYERMERERLLPKYA